MTHRNAVGTHLILGVFLATFMVTAGPTPAEAQAPFDRGAQLVSGFAGSLSSGLEDESGTAERELGEATTYGGSYRYMLSPRVSIEAAVEFARTSADAEAAGDGAAGENGQNRDDGEDGDGARVNVLYLTGSINLNLRRGGRFIPFVTAGGGAMSVDTGGAGTDTTLAGLFGAGVLFAVTDRFLLRADARDYLYAGSSLSPASLGTLMFPDGFSGIVNDLSLTGGVSWRF